MLKPVIRYLYECLAAQTEWARSLNVLEQKDVSLLPITKEQQFRLARDGSLTLSTPEAIEMANRFATGGPETSLQLGALFLVGRRPARGDTPERTFCAPLIDVPLKLRRDLSGNRVILEPDDDEFSINYALVGELLGAEEDDLEDRLADLAELVPDFPIERGEFADFLNGFRMIASGLALEDKLPRRRRKQPRMTPETEESSPSEMSSAEDDVELEKLLGGLSCGEEEDEGDDVSVEEREALEFVDFYLPTIPKGEAFRILPAAAIVLGQQTHNSLSTLSELKQMLDFPLEETAVARVFDPPSAKPVESARDKQVLLEDTFPLPLTQTQEAVVRNARSAPLTVVTGPPGTGKSYTITAIVLDAMLRGERVLVASQMDKAVEVVADKVEKIVGTFAMARSGGRAAQRELSDKINRLTGPKRSRFKLHNLSIDELSKIAEEHKELSERLETLEARYRDTIKQEQVWAESRESYDRLAPICPLPVHEISSGTLQCAQAAADRARELLTGEPGWIARLWGRWKKSRALGLLRVPRTWNSTLDELDEALHVQELADRIRNVEQNLRTPFPADALWQEIARLQADLRVKALRLLEATRGTELHALVRDETSRGHLRTFRAMLRRRNPKLKKKLLESLDPAVPLKAFPVWGCTSRTLGQILPVTPGLFDLVVIDEASQCDLATAAAALVRGKRAVIVGDPHQLRHVCFLSKVREQAAFARHGVSSAGRERFRYRRSLFDVAADVVGQDDFFLLDQHFRSHPHIIEFSNREFYDRQLRIMTERPRPEAASAIRVVNVEGRRNADSSVNPIEVEAVLGEVEKLVAETAGDKQPPSIGIVCPFRDHVDALRNAIVKTLSGKVIERHGIVVGTAHSLQGDEKDIVLFSTSIDRDSHPASLRFLENPNVFNVAITRARRSLIVVTSLPHDELPSGLLSDYLLHAKQTLQPHQPGEEFDNDFEERLARELAKQNVSLWPNFESAGVRIDLVAGEMDRHLAVLCDGLAQDDDDELDALNCHRLLVRAGWSVSRLPQRSWTADWYACYEHIEKQLRK